MPCDQNRLPFTFLCTIRVYASLGLTTINNNNNNNKIKIVLEKMRGKSVTPIFVTPITDAPLRGLSFHFVTVESYIADTANFSATNVSQFQIPS